MASDAVSAALSYRAQAPIIDGLMKELGLNGSSLDKMIAGGAGNQAPVISQEQVDEAKADSSPNVKNRKNPQQKLPIAQEEGAG